MTLPLAAPVLRPLTRDLTHACACLLGLAVTAALDLLAGQPCAPGPAILPPTHGPELDPAPAHPPAETRADTVHAGRHVPYLCAQAAPDCYCACPTCQADRCHAATCP